MKWKLACLFLPVALQGCGSNPSPISTETASTETAAKQSSPVSTSKSDAKVFSVGKSGLQVSVPPAWKAEVKGSTLSVTSPDQGVFIVFVPAPNAAEANQFVEELKTNHKKSKNYKDNGEAITSQVGALASSHQAGAFEDDGDGVSWSTDTVKAKSLVVIYSLIQDSFKVKNASETQALMNSIKASAGISLSK